MRAGRTASAVQARRFLERVPPVRPSSVPPRWMSSIGAGSGSPHRGEGYCRDVRKSTMSGVQSRAMTDAERPAEEGTRPTGAGAAGVDPGALIRSRSYRALLVFAALIGVLVSVACWAFLELIHVLQQWVYDGPAERAGVRHPALVVAAARARLAGLIDRVRDRPPARARGPRAVRGSQVRPTHDPDRAPGRPARGPRLDRPGAGAGPGGAADRPRHRPRAVRRPALEAGTCPIRRSWSWPRPRASRRSSTIFGSPVIGAVIIIEAAGLGGPTLPLVLLPGLLAAGIGSLVFIGIGSLTGLARAPTRSARCPSPRTRHPKFGDFLWTIALAIAAAVVVFVDRRARPRHEARSSRSGRSCSSPSPALVIAGARHRVRADHGTVRERGALLRARTR